MRRAGGRVSKWKLKIRRSSPRRQLRNQSSNSTLMTGPDACLQNWEIDLTLSSLLRKEMRAEPLLVLFWDRATQDSLKRIQVVKSYSYDLSHFLKNTIRSYRSSTNATEKRHSNVNNSPSASKLHVARNSRQISIF